MDLTVSMDEAKRTLPLLVEWVAEGHEVVIVRNGKPVAKLIAYSPVRGQRTPGMLAGQITIKPGFDAVPEGLDVFAR